MKSRKLGSQGPVVVSGGSGYMGMSEFYHGRDDQESLATLHRALGLGIGLVVCRPLGAAAGLPYPAAFIPKAE
jgi:hypothetical protein